MSGRQSAAIRFKFQVQQTNSKMLRTFEQATFIAGFILARNVDSCAYLRMRVNM